MGLERLLAIIGVLAMIWFAFSWATGRRTAVVELHPEELEWSAGDDQPAPITTSERPRNIVLVVADGMGFAHLAAGRAALHGIEGEAPWDIFPVSGWHRSHPASGLLTDSAAAATALATGHRSQIGAVGVDGDGKPVQNLFERATELGYRTGLVTDSYIWDATPAAFATHVEDRDFAAQILQQLTDAPLDVLFGELEDVGEGEVPTWEETEALLGASYTLVGPEPVTVEELLAIDADRRVATVYEEEQITDLDSEPNLPTLVRAGLGRITRSGEPFALLVESEELDSSSHHRDLNRTIRGLEVLDVVLTELIAFAREDGETLLLFTSDHETGGLAVSTRKGNRALRAIWASDSHTATPVPVFAMGPGAEEFSGRHSTWEIGRKLLALLEPLPVEDLSTGPSEPSAKQ